jgi:hypothetical protein
VAAFGVSACSDDSSGDAAPVESGLQVDLAAVQIESVPGGDGVPQRSATGPEATEPLPGGYTEEEYLFTGTAAIYEGPATGPARVESEDHRFTTRILVRAPESPDDFSGRVWIEPFNTTTGGDLDAAWAAVAPLIEDQGDAWVGMTVRANQVSVLQDYDPARYADLDFAENAYAWDALREVGALVKGNDPESPLADFQVEHVYMAGYSQSGVDTATFALAFNEITRLGDGAPVYDGYLPAAHAGHLSPLQSGDSIVPQFESVPMTPVDVPVVDLETNSDVEGFAVEIPTEFARQEGVAGAEDVTTPTFTYTAVGGGHTRRANSDTEDDRYQLYEIAGAPHSSGGSPDCDGTSSFPTRLFTRAAAANLVHWAEDGVAPPPAGRIELATKSDVSVSATDEYGNTVGGVRSPFVDVPLSRYEVHSGPGPTCDLVGNETPLSVEVLRQRYGDAEAYLEEFTARLDETIEAGHLLELDRQAILGTQQARANEVFGTT